MRWGLERDWTGETVSRWEAGLRFAYAEVEIPVRHQCGDVRYAAELSL